MKGNDSSINQITEGVIWKQLLLFFFPILLGTFFQQLYNTADTVVVGRFVGKEALASVGGSTAQIANLVVGFFVGLASGATVVISQFYGARDRDQVNRSLRTAYAFSIAGGILITIAGILTAPWLLKLMNTPQPLIKDSLTYLQIYFGGILFVFIYNTGSSILRAVGDSKTPLYVLIICCMLNIILDILLVVGFRMGVAGAAAATIFSQAVSSVLVTVALMRSDDIYKLHLREIRFFRQALISLIWIGLPAGIQSTMYSISNMVIQASLNSLGTDTVAAWTAFGKIDSMYWMINNSLGIAVTTFVGQNFGAGKYHRMKRIVRVGIGMGLIAAVAISCLFFTAGNMIFHLFTTDAGVISIGMKILRVMAPAYFLFVFIELLSGALRGTGDVLVPMLLTCGGVCILRVLWILFVVPLHPGLQTIIFSYPVTWLITAALFIVYYRIREKHFGEVRNP